MCLTLFDPMDHSLLRSSVYGILQARILEWIGHALAPGDLTNPEIEPVSFVSCTGSWVLYHEHHLYISILF